MRKIIEVDNSIWDKGIDVWKSILNYRKETKNPTKSQIAYFELYIKYLERLKLARSKGEFIVAHATTVPAEIFYAMDMVPILLVGTCFAITQCIKEYPKAMQISRQYGIAEEICGAHKNIIAHCVEGWLPRPNVFVDVGGGCDAFANSMKIGADLYGVPHFQVDTPYYKNQKSMAYLVSEFKKLIDFLEEQGGRKMNWDKLSISMIYSQKMLELWWEVRELRKAFPSPMDNRRAWETNWINWFFAGTPEGVYYWEVLRDELCERIRAGVGAYPKVKEKHRLLDLFMAPAWDLQILEWMQQEHGANIVMEGLIQYERGFEMDPNHPLESMAKRWYYGPLMNVLQGPTEYYIQNIIPQVEEFKPNGAIWWDGFSCRQAGAIQPVAKALEKLGIPIVRVKCDATDPAFVTREEMRRQLSDFFELLDFKN